MDDGQNWTLIAGGRWFDVKWHPGPLEPMKAYAVLGESAAAGGVYVSTNHGLSFSYAGSGQAPSNLIGNSRLAIISLVIFFIAGIALLAKVNIERGIQTAQADDAKMIAVD